MSKTKTLLKVIGILLLIALISIAINIFLVNNNLSIVSDVFLDGENVIISKEAKQQLDEIYIPMPDIEIPACLAGEITKEGKIRIERVEKATIIKSNATTVEYIRCSVFTNSFKILGTIHNHINEMCYLSDQDITTYSSDMRRGQTIIGLYCGDYTFFVLSKMDYQLELW